MNYGITKDGLNSKDFTVIKEELLKRWGDSFNTIDTDEDGGFGQIGNSVSYTANDFWLIVEDIFLNMNPNTAIGENLKRLLALQGMTPLGASPVSVEVLCGGVNNTTIPVGSTATHGASGRQFESTDPILLSYNELNRFEFTVDSDLVNGDDVSFIITSQNFGATKLEYVNNSDDTATLEVCEYLATQLRNNSVICDISSVEITNDDTLVVTSYSPTRTIAVGTFENGVVNKVWRNGNFTGIETGSFMVAPFTITDHDQNTTGWDDVTNLLSGTGGRDVENDDDLRRRLKLYKQYGSSGSRYAIASKIWQDVKGITNLIISENNTDFEDEFGRPPHTINCVVDGGTPASFCKIIAENLTGGIATTGKQSFTVTDLSYQSDPMIIKYDRVGSIFGHIKIIIDDFNEEEILPSDAKSLIRDSIYYELNKNNEVGADVISQKYVGAVYRAVAGLAKIRIYVAVTGLPDTDPNGDVKGRPWDYSTDYNSGWVDGTLVVSPYDRVEWRDAYNRITIEGLI